MEKTVEIKTLWLRIMVLALILSVGRFELQAATTTNGLVFTNAADIHHLNRKASTLGYPVQVRGVVTYSDPQWTLLFIRDSSAAVFVALSGKTYPTNGELVEVTGRTDDGSFLPVVADASWRHLGSGSMPEPRRIRQPDRYAAEIDCEWSELVGVVRRVSLTSEPAHVQLDIVGKECSARVFLPTRGDRDLTAFNEMIDAKVSVVGVGGVDYDDPSGVIRLKVFAPNVSFVRVLRPRPPDPFGVPLVSLSTLIGGLGTNLPTHRVHVRGLITYLDSTNQLILQEEDNALRIQVADTKEFKVGDGAEAVGFISPGGFSAVLQNSMVRPARAKPRAEPVTVSPATVLWGNYDARLVRLTGIVQTCELTETDQIMTLLQDGILFGVCLRAAPTASTWQQRKKGDRVSVTGICSVQGAHRAAPQSFQILPRSESDIAALPLVREFSAKQVVLIICFAAAAWGVILLWGMLLRQRVREQTRELLEASRRAGMAEVATAVLHNVGNVLNSVNVSATLVNDRLRRTRAENLNQAAELIGNRMNDLGVFLSEDPKGQKLRSYLKEIGGALVRENEETKAEVDLLLKNVDHIKTIVAMQQSYARVGGNLERLDAQDLMEDAVQVGWSALERDQIQLFREYKTTVPQVLVDRHKVLQILINLLSNARHAVQEKSTRERRITLSIFLGQSGQVCLRVSDNGVGIAPGDLDRIFNQGFTTKRDGHGFGLHSGANAAKELNGSLRAQSDGVGRGAAFTLELPITKESFRAPATVPRAVNAPVPATQ